MCYCIRKNEGAKWNVLKERHCEANAVTPLTPSLSVSSEASTRWPATQGLCSRSMPGRPWPERNFLNSETFVCLSNLYFCDKEYRWANREAALGRKHSIHSIMFNV